MWLETITLVTLESSKKRLGRLNREIVADERFQALRIDFFYAQHTDLHVCWHLFHDSVFSSDFSTQAETLIEQVSHFGPVHYLAWHPFEHESNEFGEPRKHL